MSGDFKDFIIEFIYHRFEQLGIVSQWDCGFVHPREKKVTFAFRLPLTDQRRAS
jgi:hypothetical protein